MFLIESSYWTVLPQNFLISSDPIPKSSPKADWLLLGHWLISKPHHSDWGKTWPQIGRKYAASHFAFPKKCHMFVSSTFGYKGGFMWTMRLTRIWRALCTCPASRRSAACLLAKTSWIGSERHQAFRLRIPSAWKKLLVFSLSAGCFLWSVACLPRCREAMPGLPSMPPRDQAGRCFAEPWQSKLWCCTSLRLGSSEATQGDTRYMYLICRCFPFFLPFPTIWICDFLFLLDAPTKLPPMQKFFFFSFAELRFQNSHKAASKEICVVGGKKHSANYREKLSHQV